MFVPFVQKRINAFLARVRDVNIPADTAAVLLCVRGDVSVCLQTLQDGIQRGFRHLDAGGYLPDDLVAIRWSPAQHRQHAYVQQALFPLDIQSVRSFPDTMQYILCIIQYVPGVLSILRKNFYRTHKT